MKMGDHYANGYTGLYFFVAILAVVLFGTSCGSIDVSQDPPGAQGPIELKFWDLEKGRVTTVVADSLSFSGETQQDIQVHQVRIELPLADGAIQVETAEAFIQQAGAQALRIRTRLNFTGIFKEKKLHGHASALDLRDGGSKGLLNDPDFYWGDQRFLAASLYVEESSIPGIEQTLRLQEVHMDISVPVQAESDMSSTSTSSITPTSASQSTTPLDVQPEIIHMRTQLLVWNRATGKVMNKATKKIASDIIRAPEIIFIDGTLNAQKIQATADHLEADLDAQTCTLFQFQGTWGEQALQAQRLVFQQLVLREDSEHVEQTVSTKNTSTTLVFLHELRMQSTLRNNDLLHMETTLAHFDQDTQTLYSDRRVDFHGILSTRKMRGHAAGMQLAQGIESGLTVASLSDVVASWGPQDLQAQHMRMESDEHVQLENFILETPVRNGSMRMRGAAASIVAAIDAQRSLLESKQKVFFSGLLNGKRIDGHAERMDVRAQDIDKSHDTENAPSTYVSTLHDVDFMWGSQRLIAARMQMFEEGDIILHAIRITTPVQGGSLEMRTNKAVLDNIKKTMRIDQRVDFSGTLDNKKITGHAVAINMYDSDSENPSTGTDCKLEMADFIWGAQHITADELHLRGKESISGRNWKVVPVDKE